MRHFRFVGCLVVLLTLVACQGAHVGLEMGSGTARTEDRAIGSFTAIHVAETIAAEVRLGSPASVRVTADDNLLDNVKTSVNGSELDVRIDGAVSTKTPIRVDVTVPSLEAVRVESAARFHADGLALPTLDVKADSAGQVDVSGHVDKLTADVTAGAQLVGGDLVATTADVRLDSGSVARLLVTDRVTGRVSAGAVLTVGGSPQSVEVTTESGGQVIHG